MQSVQPINTPAPYIGGKRNLASRITAKIDQIPHTLYAEPFCGMGGIFFKRTQKPKNEALNDYNRDVANFFKIIQRHYDEFMRCLRWHLNGRQWFNEYKDLNPDCLTDVERAVRFYYLQVTAFGGKVSGKNFGTDPNRTGRFNAVKVRKKLHDVHERLLDTVIEQLDFEAFILKYDREGTLFYLDPPYYNCEKDYGKDLFCRADFERLSNVLRGIKGKFIMSINDTPEIREIFAGFTFEWEDTSYSIAKKSSKKVQELVISNQ